MKKIEKLLPFSFKGYDKLFMGASKVLFLNIETTGLRPRSSFVYMIGCAFSDEKGLSLVTWLAENKTQERLLFEDFSNFILRFDRIVSFGGQAFTYRFLRERMENYDLGSTMFSTGIHLTDIQKDLSPIKEQLALSDFKKSSAEQFMGIRRKHAISGEKLIDLYQQYELNADNAIEDILIAHNEEDLLSLAELFKLTSYTEIHKGHFTLSDILIEENLCHFILESEYPFPEKISYETEFSHIYMDGSLIHIYVASASGSLKYFLPGSPKDYYYLPNEDQAIHKSLAMYVDKNFRKKATASNCYIWNEGIYIPSHDSDTYRVFQTDYKSLPYYIQVLPEEWKKEPEKLSRFLLSYL